MRSGEGMAAGLEMGERREEAGACLPAGSLAGLERGWRL